MYRIINIIFLIPLFSFSQEDSTFLKIPYKDGSIVYENVFYIDRINDQTKVFNLVKSALIRSTNYKAVKIDEDRTSGNITTEISFAFTAKPGIARIALNATTRLSIDVKENRFRVRLYNNSAMFTLMGQAVIYDMPKVYEAEKLNQEKGKWKPAKSVVLPWNDSLSLILNSFAYVVSKGINDDF
ncbi:MAG: hypothetical protein ACO1NK_04120 [Sediminibacterium sp.]|jgi:hypothetical protein